MEPELLPLAVDRDSKPPMPSHHNTVSPLPAAECPICGATYRLRDSLIKHMKSHDGQTRCTVCEQLFSTMQNLRRHMLLKHQMARGEVDIVTNNRRAQREAMEAQYAAAMAGAASVPPPEGSHYSGRH